MKEHTKERILEIIEVFVLCTLIVARFLISEDNIAWISLLNYLGLFIAFASFFMMSCEEFSTKKKFNVVAGVFVVVMIILSVIAGLIFAGLIVLNTKWNDIILLVTLLVSLPTRLYISWISDFVKD